MVNSTCQWVREWLPLFVEEHDELAGDQGGLSPETRAAIGAHLDDCDDCRDRRSALTDVMSILSLVAADSPVSPEPSSVLQGLNERIRQQQLQSTSPWSRAWRALGISWLTASRRTAGGRQALASLRCERPLQAAWLRDSVHEFVGDVTARLRAPQWNGRGISLRFSDFRPNLGVGMAMAGLFLFAFLLAGFIRHRQFEAEAQIASNSAAIPGADLFDDGPRPLELFAIERPDNLRLDRGTEAERVETTPSTSEPLAIAVALPSTSTRPTTDAPPATAKNPVAGLNAVVTTASATTTAATTSKSKTTASAPRFDFDLEHGTPMLPETRGGKPAY